jgi:hypothetical protein
VATSLDTYMPYDSGPGSNVSEDGWRQFARHFRGDGVIRNVGSEFRPFGDSTGMQVKAPSGECWIRGQWGTSTSTKTLAIATAHATLQRLDLIILRNDFVNNRIELDILTGVAGSGSFPTLTQNTVKWEIQLGQVTVPAAAVTITSGNVVSLPQFTDGSCSYTVDSGLQTVLNNTITLVDWDLPQFDSSAVDRNGLNKFILKRAGAWMFAVNIAWNGNTNGTRFVWVDRTADTGFTNRLGINSVPPISGFETVQTTVAMDRFNANEEVCVCVFQNSGIGLGISNIWSATRVAMYWLGP